MPPPNEALYPNTNATISPATLQVNDRVSVFKRLNGDVIIYECTVTIVGDTYFSATRINKTTYHANGTEENEEMPTEYEESFDNFFGQTPFKWVKIEPETPKKAPPLEKPYDDLGSAAERLFGGNRKSKRKHKKKKTRKYNSKRK